MPALAAPKSELVLPRLRPDQYAIAVHPAKVKVLAMGRRWGKTVMSGVIALTAASRGLRVAWVVPNYKNGRPLWRWARAIVGPLKNAGVVNVLEQERTIEFVGSGGFLGIYSADNADAIRGEWFHIVIMDESARIAEDVWTDVIQPTLADVGGDAILISTPKGKNWFWREWMRGIADGQYTAAFRAPSRDNPNPRIQRAAAIAKAVTAEGTYRQEWEAEFVEEANPTWSQEWFEHNRYSIESELESYQVIARILSYDTALKDNSNSAYSVNVVGELLADYRLRIRWAWRDRLGFPALVSRIEQDAERWNYDGKLFEILIEDKVSGTSAYQTLKNAWPADRGRMLKAYMPTASKSARFEQAGVWAKNGCVLLPFPSEQTPWLAPLEMELFEESEFVDQRDTIAQLVLWNEHRLSRGLRLREELQRRATVA